MKTLWMVLMLVFAMPVLAATTPTVKEDVAMESWRLRTNPIIRNERAAKPVEQVAVWLWFRNVMNPWARNEINPFIRNTG